MKIAVISSQVFRCPPAGYSGLEMVAYHAAAGLAALGHQVALVAPDGSRCPGGEVIPTGPAGQWDERAAYDRYWKFLPSFDAVIDNSWTKFSYLLKAEGRLAAPVLGVWHAPVDTMYKSLPPVEKPCTVLISDDQRAHYEALFGRPGRTCRNGVDTSFYRAADGVARTDRALFLARFSRIKGADLAARACRDAGVPLDLVGDTTITNEPDFLAEVQALCDGDRVRLVGPESRDGCVLRYSAASLFVHPNQRFREPFGLAPVEAVACGLPVVAWDHGAMRETVLPGVTGTLVGSYEELAVAVGYWRDRMQQPDAGETRDACRRQAENFSVQRMARRYEELCAEALKTGGW